MLEQFVAVMPGTLGPALLVMCMSVMLTVGEGRDKPISSPMASVGNPHRIGGGDRVRRTACIRGD